MPIDSSPPRALIVGFISQAVEELNTLREKLSVDFLQSKTRQEFFDDCETKYKNVEVLLLDSSVSWYKRRNCMNSRFTYKNRGY